MEHYKSAPVAIDQPVGVVYERLSRLDALTPYVGDKVEGWQADQDSCSFRVQGFPVGLAVAERVPSQLIRVAPQGATPMQFGLQIRLEERSETGCTMQIGLDVELSMMLRMMIGGKLQGAVDQMAQVVAQALNRPAA